jgi:hypothetical protein
VSESRKVTYQVSEELVREVRERVREGVRRAATDPLVVRDIAAVEDELNGVEEQL